MNKLQAIRSRVGGGIGIKDKVSDEDLIGVRHLFMRRYGWMSIEEFRKITIPELFGLLEQFDREKKEGEKQSKKMKSKNKGMGRRR
jgi:hypothetical protein|tara:strand:+ start:22743 stop:23000 length:258 start_codon:yes stop_codon:yes gene_type:complete